MISIEIHTAMANRQRDTIKTWKKDELVRELVANNYAVEAVLAPEEQFDHPQLQANQMVATVEDPDLGPTTQIGVPIHLLGTPGAITSGQPRVGEHNQEIWGGLGFDADAIAAITAPIANPEGDDADAPPKIRSAPDTSVHVRALDRARRVARSARRRGARRLRPVPRGSVRADGHRRPRRRRHQGRARHRRRHAPGRHAVLRVPARQARHRARTSRIPTASRSRSSSSPRPTSCTTT